MSEDLSLNVYKAKPFEENLLQCSSGINLTNVRCLLCRIME